MGALCNFNSNSLEFTIKLRIVCEPKPLAKLNNTLNAKILICSIAFRISNRTKYRKKVITTLKEKHVN